MVVYLLSTSPKNGVELMDGVEGITRGWWRPTAGSIYPLLEKMVEEGTIQKRDDGRYELTPDARKEATASFGPRARGPQTVGDMVTEMHSFVSYMEDVSNSGKESLEPHKGKLRVLAKRLAELVGEDDASKHS